MLGIEWHRKTKFYLSFYRYQNTGFRNHIRKLLADLVE